MWAHEYWIDEEQQSKQTSGSMMTGLLVGLAIGTAAGILWAPKPGAEMRTQVRSSAQRLGRRAAEAYDGVSHAVGDVAARSRRVVDAGREAFESARSAETASGPAPVPLP